MTHDGVSAYVGMPKLRMNGRIRGNEPVPIAGWNVGVTTSRTIQAYTALPGADPNTPRSLL